MPVSNETVNVLSASEIHFALSRMSSVTGDSKSYLSVPLYQPVNLKPAFSGSAGATTLSFSVTVFISFSLPLSGSNVTVKDFASSFCVHFAVSVMSAVTGEEKSYFSDPRYHPSNMNPDFTGFSGSETLPFSSTT